MRHEIKTRKYKFGGINKGWYCENAQWVLFVLVTMVNVGTPLAARCFSRERRHSLSGSRRTKHCKETHVSILIDVLQRDAWGTGVKKPRGGGSIQGILIGKKDNVQIQPDSDRISITVNSTMRGGMTLYVWQYIL